MVIAAIAATSLVSCRKPPKEPESPETTSPDIGAEAAPPVELERTYVGGGTDPAGNKYVCEVELTPAREVYWVVRQVDDGTPYDGVGIREGDTFVVGFRDESGYGVIAYTVNPDGSLGGISTHEDSTKVGAEKLAKK